jgi:hypothetical protein
MVTVSHFQLCLIFAGKAYSELHSKGQLLVMPANIKLELNATDLTNTLAYYDNYDHKSLIEQALGSSMKLSTVVILPYGNKVACLPLPLTTTLI